MTNDNPSAAERATVRGVGDQLRLFELAVAVREANRNHRAARAIAGAARQASNAAADAHNRAERDVEAKGDLLRAALKDLQDHLMQTPAVEPTPAATHRCKICGALWRLIPADVNWKATWSLVSKTAGKCCDNVAMGDQIEELPA